MGEEGKALVYELRKFQPDTTMCNEAADRIEALSAENERLREALNEIKRLLSYANQDAVNEAIAQGNKNMAWHKARAALGETK